jgi:vacuolar-type H+-ATPase subunit F/Vma7
MEKVTNTYRIAVIGSHSLELGFKIAGITTSYAASTGAEAEPLIHKLMQDEGIGIIVISGSLAREIRDRKINEALASSMKPLFIVVSDSGDKEEYKDNLRQLIIRALGIDIMKAKTQT